MPHHILRRGAVLTALTLLGLHGAGAAHAQSPEDGPSSLEVALTGPSTGKAGGTGEFAVAVQNTGRAPVRQLQLSSQLPEGVTVRSVGISDSWACVFGRTLQCTLEGDLRAGQTTATLPFELFFDGLVEGRQEIVAVVGQGSGGAVRYDRGIAVVDVEPEPAPPAQPPAPQQPAPQQPVAAPAQQPVTQQPAAAQPAAQAPAQRRAPVAAATSAPSAPAAATEPTPDPATEGEAAADEAPSTLPFVADDDVDSTEDRDEAEAASSGGGSEPSTVAASQSSGLDDLYTALLALVFGVLLVAFLFLVSRAVLQRRGRLA